jgi:hypothetical protein
LWCSQNNYDSQEDLAKFGYKLNVKEKCFKTFFYVFGYILESCL